MSGMKIGLADAGWEMSIAGDESLLKNKFPILLFYLLLNIIIN